MEKLKDIKKVIMPIVILIIMIGAIVVATVGFNFGLMYQSHKRVEIYIDKEFSVEDVNNIVKEVLPNEEIIIQDVETFNKEISFTVKQISDEQAKTLESKIKEKYEIDEKAESVIVLKEPHTKLSDIMKPYVKPLVITTIIICIYLLIRFRKIGILKAGLIPIAVLITIQALYYSVWAICRIPVSKITMPLSLLVYILTACVVTVALQNMDDKAIENK